MRQKLTFLAVLVFASVTLLPAQTGRLASVKVPFEFTVGSKVLPAGDYAVDRDDANLKFSAKKGPVTRVPILTRLAQLNNSPQSFTLVFDKAEDGCRFLSEVWTPGQDGFLVLNNAKKHTHEVVR